MPAVSVSVAGLAAAALVLGGVPASAAPASATASATAGSPVPARTAAAPPADCRAIPVEADGPHRSAEARESFGVDGTGVTIGIISSSFATAPGTATTLEQDIALGVLPGPGNPCGYETPVEVVFDVAPGTGTDEGRAMAQLIHGIAPGARLLFASSDTPPGQPADPRIVFAAVEALADAGADIIVDDILEPAFDLVFQKGLTSAQMDESSAANPELIFLSSAGNANALGPEGTPVAGRPIASWQTSAYRPAACPDWMTDGSPDDVDCLDFSPDAAGDTSFGIELHGSARPEHSIVQWADAAAVGSELPTVLEMRIYDAARTRVATTSLTTPLFPVSMLDPSDPPAAELPAGDYEIVVVRTRDGGENPAVWMRPFAPSAALSFVPEYWQSTGDDLVGPTVAGHAAHGSSIGVGAADWTTPDVPEDYSSIGPGIQRLEPFEETGVSPPLPEPIVTTTPQITGVDGTQTSFFGSQDSSGAYRFYGTSAAAPNVAAVLALARSYAPETPRDELQRLLYETALPMTNPYAEFGHDDANVIGAGLADAFALLEALAPPPPTPEPSPTPEPTPDPTPTAAPAVLPATGGELGGPLLSALLLAALGLAALGLAALRARATAPPRAWAAARHPAPSAPSTRAARAPRAPRRRRR